MVGIIQTYNNTNEKNMDFEFSYESKIFFFFKKKHLAQLHSIGKKTKKIPLPELSPNSQE